MIDLNRNGLIEPDEMFGLLTTTKERLTEEEVRSILIKGGQKHDEGVDFEGFKQIMRKSKSLQFKLMSTYRIIFIMGGPGSGKGTYCEQLIEQNSNLVHVSVGDLLREEVKAPTALGYQLKMQMARGELLDAGIVITLVDKFLAESPGRIVLLDGFPRTIEDAFGFYEQFGPGEYCILFECPNKVMVNRITERGKVSGRPDDTEKIAWRRVKVFRKQNDIQLEFMKEKGIKVYEIDTRKDIEENVKDLLELPLLKP